MAGNLDDETRERGRGPLGETLSLPEEGKGEDREKRAASAGQPDTLPLLPFPSLPFVAILAQAILAQAILAQGGLRHTDRVAVAATTTTSP